MGAKGDEYGTWSEPVDSKGVVQLSTYGIRPAEAKDRSRTAGRVFKSKGKRVYTPGVFSRE